MRKVSVVVLALMMCTLLVIVSGCSNSETPLGSKDTDVEVTKSAETQTSEDKDINEEVTEPVITKVEEPIVVSTEDFHSILKYNTTTGKDEEFFVRLVKVHTDYDDVKAIVDRYEGGWQIDVDNPGSSVAQYAVVEYMTYWPNGTPVDASFPKLSHKGEATLANAGERESSSLKYDGISLIGWNVSIGMNEEFLNVGEIYTGYELVCIFKDMPLDQFDVCFGRYSDRQVWYSATGEYIETIENTSD